MIINRYILLFVFLSICVSSTLTIASEPNIQNYTFSIFGSLWQSIVNFFNHLISPSVPTSIPPSTTTRPQTTSIATTTIQQTTSTYHTTTSSTTTTSTTTTIPSTTIPQSTATSSNEGPYSIGFKPYQTIPFGGTVNYTVSPRNTSGLSFGVYNSNVDITISQNGEVIYQGTLTGLPFNELFEHPGCSCSYGYVNLNSGATVNIRIHNTGSTNAYFSYNLYSSHINTSIASLILYAGQFAINFAPFSTPLNHGISFKVKAPTYTQPTSLAMWVAEGGANWDAQVGFTTITSNYGAGDVSYPFFEVFPGGGSAPGGQDYNYPLVPGQTYTFTMQQISGNTWEFLVDGTLIETSWPSALNGTYTFDSSQANQNTDFAIESFVDQGGGMPNVTNPVYVPVAMQFYVGGEWINANSLYLPSEGISENWQNGWVTSPPNVSIWGIEGNLQNSLLPLGALIFGSSIRPIITSGTTYYTNAGTGAISAPTTTTTTSQSAGNVDVTLNTPQINGYNVTVNGAATTTSGTISTIEVNWGDGTTTTGWFPFTHTYQSSGQFSIFATAQNSNGAVGASSNVTVNT